MREDKIFSFLSFFARNPILAAICIVFFVGDIVLLTCIIYDRIHRKEVMELQSGYDEMWKSKEESDGLLKGMKDSYEQMSKEFNRTNTMYKELEKRTGAQTGLDSKVASLTGDLNTCQSKNLDFISQISGEESTIESLRNQLHDSEEIAAGLKKLLARKLALEPTWIKAGEAFTAFNGDFTIAVEEASDKNQCSKGSTTAVSLKSENDKKTLCVRMDQPENFKHKGKTYSIDLLGVREKEQTREYLVSILNERDKP